MCHYTTLWNTKDHLWQFSHVCNSITLTSVYTLAYVCSWILSNAQNALLWHKYTPRDVRAIHRVNGDTLSQATPDLRQTLLQFIDIMKLTSVTNVSMHTSTPKEDILASNVSQEYTHNKVYLISFVNNKAKQWCCVRYSEFCYYWYCFSQGSVATHYRCGEKYDTRLVANLLVSPTVKKFWKSVNISQSYKRISSSTFFMAHRLLLGTNLIQGKKCAISR